MDFKKLDDKTLIQLASPNSGIHTELRNRGIIRTKNLTGEIGEYLTVNFYNQTRGLTNLDIPSAGVKNLDAVGRNGSRYSIKTITSRKGTTGSFWNLSGDLKEEKHFEFLIICILTNDYELDMIIELNWEQFIQFIRPNSRMKNHQISITNKLLDEATIHFDRINK